MICARTFLAALLVLPGVAVAVPPVSVDARVEALLKQMTLEEKLGQLQQLGGPIEGNQELIELAAEGKLGSTLNVRGAKHVNAIQRAAMERSRLKIPLIFGFDVIHGYRTVFPIPLALASSWDPALVEGVARVSAREAYADGLRWTFSPMLDVSRDPRWGRVAEGAGEDPYLGAMMGRAFVRGYQGDDPSAPDTLAACAKHWVGYGAAEGGRDYNTTEISQRTLREVYFPPFKAAADAGVLTFMSAFNDLNGVPASANKFTLTDVLRGEWRFEGFVVSDWDAVAQLIPHGLAENGRQAAGEALTAGVDMEMDSRLYGANLPALVKDGKISMEQIDEAVRRVLRVKARLGLFERPYANEGPVAAAPDAQARNAARAAAVRTFVLLKNEGGILPLPKTAKTIAVIGPVANDGEALIGSWHGDGRPEEVTTILSGIRAALPDSKVVFKIGCPVIGGSDVGFAGAVAAAKSADVVVLALGEAGDMTGEASSRAYLDIPGRQVDLAKAVLAVGKPTAVVLINGRPLTFSWLAEHVPAILEAWEPGTEGGRAIADILFGDANPGGKLSMTFPRTLGQIPLYYNHKNTGRPPQDADRYTSKYLDAPVTPQYPFGYGLSYTMFELSDLKLSAGTINRDGRVVATVTVANTGARLGDEVVQLYIHRLMASVTRPVRELKGFSRVRLNPGEKKEVSFTLTPQDFGFVGIDGKWSVEPGRVEVLAGQSSVGGLRALLTIK